MFFFKSLAVFSTLAFGALSALAAPAASAVENGLVARCDCKPVPAIFADLTADINVSLVALAHTTKDNCTEAYISPLIADVKAKVAVAIGDIKLLGGQPIDVVLGVGVDVNVLAKIVADLVISVFAAIRVVLNVCLSVNLSVVIALVAGLGEVIGALVVAVVNVCGGLVVGLDVVILGLISVVLDVIVRLNVSLFAVIGVHL